VSNDDIRAAKRASLNANGGHVATVINLHSRALVCWSAADHMRTSLITDALDVGITHFSSVATGSTPNSTFFSSMNFTINAVGG